MAAGPKRSLVYLAIDPDPDEPADVIGDEPIWHDGHVVGWVTSGGYAHHTATSLGFGYVPAALATADAEFEVEIIGHRRPARLLTEPVLDPTGERMRA
jgi:dimethylglycine dehydrogenase